MSVNDFTLFRLQKGLLFLLRYVRQKIPRQDPMHQHIRGFDETPIMATSRDPRCAIAISTAIIRLLINTDPRLATSLGTAVSNRGPHIRDYFQKTESTWNGETDVHLYTMSALPPKADIG